ncbi:MAG: hypothetical protein ACRCXK_07650 [Wohlfahrtiimonas sp.]|jgi:ABC-type phosphate transport system permease subunit
MKFIGIVFGLFVLFVVSMSLGMFIGEIFYDKGGLIGIGGFSDAFIHGIGIGFVIFIIAVVFIPIFFSISSSKKKE